MAKRPKGYFFYGSVNCRKSIIFLFLPILLIFSVSCSSKKEILIASTTSLYDFGLIDRAIPSFEKRYNYKLTVIPAGSGQALSMGRLGKVDAIFSHLPQEEENFIKKGFGTLRIPFAFNYFILVGPLENPAGIEKEITMKQAFKRIYENGSLFISRGDHSGTHMKELEIWKSIGLNPEGKRWHLEVGVGMGQALITASEKSAYTLSDITSFFKMKKRLKLKIIAEESNLKNIYSLIIVKGTDPEKASILREFALSEDFKKIILQSGRVDGNETLFPY